MSGWTDSVALTATDLERRILEVAPGGALRPGARLPTERRLAELLGVSRTSIRHALSRLDAAGILSREVGRGTFVRPEPVHSEASARVSHLTDVAPADVMAVRSLVEPQAMGLVILHATERDIEEMDRCLAGGDIADSHADFEAWDRALHRSLIDATHSRLLQALYHMVEDARDNQVWGQLKRRNDSTERRGTYQCEHHRIVDSVKARDYVGATDAARDHLATVSVNLFGRVI